MRTTLVLTMVAVLVATTHAFYQSDADVVELTPETFDKKVVKSSSVWMVEFYAPWCGHCKNLAPEWRKAGAALKGIAKIGAVDAEKHAALGSKFGVQGFPTIKLFVNGKATEYDGGRKAQDIVAAVHKAIGEESKRRL